MAGNRDAGALSLPAPALALAFFGVAALVYAALTVGEGANSIEDTLAWETWKAFAGFAVAVALTSGGIGALAVRAAIHPPDAREDELGRWSRPARLAAPLTSGSAGAPSATVFAYAVVAIVLVVGVFVFLGFVPPDTHRWPDDLEAQERAATVAVVVGLAAVPWLVLVWLLQRHFAHQARKKAVFSTTELRTLWDLLSSIVLAFAVFVVLALVSTGALRAAYFAGDKDPAADKNGPEFPSSEVLLYGAFFALLLATISLPMVAAYRAAARRRVMTSCPLTDEDEEPSSATKDRLDRMEALLHLDVGLLRSPITALSVFTPLITAALAAYLPDLASS